ncbi:collagen binding domain-containing protein [Microbacterium sp. NPDC057659]|uniref:MSCRAMM family protein n=1 Tax=Microbacterium sp. NPDC057659 TaxID=3346198 RepID=UPI00366B7CB9
MREKALVTVATVIAALIVPLGLAAPASAATLQPSGLKTGMIIDGTFTPGNPPETFNWANFITDIQPNGDFTFVPTGGYTTAQGGRSTGVFQGAFAWDNGQSDKACNVGAEASGAPPSQNPNTNPWLPGTAKPNGQGDLCSSTYGLELVTQPDGSRHFVLYGAWTRYDGAGQVSIFQHLEGPGPGRCDDVLLEFDYESGSPTTARVLRWQPTANDRCANEVGPGTWVANGPVVDFDWAVGVRPNSGGWPAYTNQRAETFGEFAIDLNSAGVFTPDECISFGVSEMFTRTGNSPQANIQDFADHGDDRMTLANCGTLKVTKATVPGQIAPDDQFGFTVTRDGGPVIPGPPVVDTITDTLTAEQTKTYTGVLASSSYHIDETSIPPPWALQSLVCTAIPLEGGAAQEFVIRGPDDAFPVSAQNTTECVITNEAAVVTVEKRTLPADSSQTFGFDVTGQDTFSLGNGQRQSFAVPVGQATTITEAESPGWQTPEISCDAPSTVDGRSTTVTPTAGQNITCTYTNTQLGTVVISKEAHGVDGRTFSFTSDLPGGEAFDIAVPNGDGTLYEKTFGNVPPGDYSITEKTDAATPPTLLADLSCTYGGADHTGDTATRTIGLSVKPGETVNCFFTNSTPGSIAVIKRTLPVEQDQLFDFEFTPPEGDAIPFRLNGNSTPPNVALRSFTGLTPGRYTVSEPADVDGWALDGVDCNGADWTESADGRGAVIDLDFTEAVVCFFTNRADPASLAVTKSVQGADPAFDWAFGFDLVAPDGSVMARTVTTAAPTAGWGELVPGTTYTLRETGSAPAGWTRGDIVCDGLEDADPLRAGFQFAAAPGQSIACSVQNTAETSSISVAKVAAGIGADYDWSFDLSISPVPTGQGGTKTVSGTGQSGETVSWAGLIPGRTYSITEAVSGGWTVGVACTGTTDENPDAAGLQFTAPVGAQLDCTFTNQATAGTGTLTKTAAGGDGNFEFVLTDLDHAIDPILTAVTTEGGKGVVALPPIIPGVRYSLVETDGPDWVEGPLTCRITPGDGSAAYDIEDLSDFSVKPGDVGACTAANTAYGSIVIAKAVGGPDGRFSFRGDWLDSPEFSIKTTDGTGLKVFDHIEPGDYTVSELQEGGYDTTDLVCVDSDADGMPSTVDDLVGSIVLDPGETVTCTFTNGAWGMIVVDKSTIPAGADDSFDFEWGPDSGPSDTFALTDASTPFRTDPLKPGAYRVTEAGKDGWELQGIACTGAETPVHVDGASAVIALDLGETVFCTFTNVQNEGPGPTPTPTSPVMPTSGPPSPGPTSPPAAGGDGGLPATGYVAGPLGLIALGLLVTGILLVLRRRERHSDGAAEL